MFHISTVPTCVIEAKDPFESLTDFWGIRDVFLNIERELTLWSVAPISMIQGCGVVKFVGKWILPAILWKV